eukprot:1182873-Prorocentrum_minimum.AAC.1
MHALLKSTLRLDRPTFCPLPPRVLALTPRPARCFPQPSRLHYHPGPLDRPHQADPPVALRSPPRPTHLHRWYSPPLPLAAAAAAAAGAIPADASLARLSSWKRPRLAGGARGLDPAAAAAAAAVAFRLAISSSYLHRAANQSAVRTGVLRR